MVQAPKEFNVAVGQIAGQVSSLVQTCVGILTKRVRNETLGRQLWLVAVAARYADPTNAQLPRYPNGNWLEVGIQNIDLDVCDGPPNRDTGAVLVRLAHPGRHVDGCFSRTIQVVEFGIQTCKKSLLELNRQYFTTAHDPSNTRHGEIIKMTRISLLTLCSYMFLLGGPASGQTGFFDDFEEANARPVPWQLANVQNGTAEIVDGDFLLTPITDDCCFGPFTDFDHRDLEIMMQVRFLESPQNPGFIIAGFRYYEEIDNLYWAGIGEDGSLWLGTTENGFVSIQRRTAAGIVDPVGHDVNLQIGIVGSAMSIFAWDEGEDKPLTPQLEWEDRLNRFPAGKWVAIAYKPPPNKTPAIIRSFGAIAVSEPSGLQAGDADQDFDFDQLDVVRVLGAGKYLTGEPATWGEGDWDGAPCGEPGNTPLGNGFFDQIDVIRALCSNTYLTGPYAVINKGGQEGDGQTSIVYNAQTGEVGVDAPAGVDLTSVNIDSSSGIFTGDAAENLGGSFDNDADSNIFKATFGSSFGSLSFGNVAQTGLSENFVANDLTVVGSLAGGGDLGNVDLVYVPEPSTIGTLVIGLLLGLRGFRRMD